MENDIIRERLKGLYVAIDSLTGIGAAKGVMAGELGIMAIRVKEVAELLEKTESLLSSVVAERDEFQGDNMELVQMRHEIAEEKTKLAKTAKDRITSLQKHLQAAEEERDKLKVERDQQEKQLHDLSEEFSKLRNRLTQYHQRRKAYGEAEERVCKLCQKVFLDTENYNWSCRTHQSEFGGEIWWCCGKPGKDAAGCRISKHESKEEDEEAELAKKEEEAQRQSLQKCPSCKGYGHQPSDCPKDPNYRSKFDLADESHRLDRILGTKRKHTLPSPEFSVLALNTLIGQSDVREFNDKDPVTSNSESPITDEDGEGLAAFPDIKDMKSRVPKQRSAVSLDQAIQNNEEKPLLQTFSVRVKRVSKTRSMQNSPRAEGRKNRFMGEMIAPRDGDVTVNCFLPSGSILEVQLYFKKGEDAYSVILRELTKEGLSHSLMPQIVTALKDVFLAERRYTPISERVGRKAYPLSLKKPGCWFDYTHQFSTPSSIAQLKSLQSEACTLMTLLKSDRSKFYESTPLAESTSYEAHKALEKAENEFKAREKSIIDSFWARLGQEQVEGVAGGVLAQRENKVEFRRRVSVSVGALRKRRVGVTVLLCEDMFLEKVDDEDREGEEYPGFTHPENVYTVEMTALCLPITVQDGVPSLLPDLIRRCEEAPELHFPNIREQIEKLGNLGKTGGQGIGFTRHSNIGLARGAFHLGNEGLIRLSISCFPNISFLPPPSAPSLPILLCIPAVTNSFPTSVVDFFL